MLKFKTASIIFITGLLIVVLLHYFFFVTLWWLLLPIAIYKLQVICGSAIIDSNFFTKVYCNSDTSEKEIAITFDDGPSNEYTLKVLSVLAKYNAPATFFVIGKNIKGNENIIQQIDSAGHTIGNHTFSHSFFIDFKSTPGFMYELDATSDAVYDILKKRMRLFRPPYGVTTPNLVKAAKNLDYKVIGWNVRSLDTKNDSSEKITARVVSKIKPGAVILFHDTSDKTINVLEQTLNFAEKNGFKIVSLEQLLIIKAYE